MPAYRHPHPLLHPVFCDYGESRWSIEFNVHKAYKGSKSADDVHGLQMELWNGKEIKKVLFRWQSKLFERDFDIKQKNNKEKALKVSRASRLGRVAANPKWKAPVSIDSIFEEEHWNGRLQVSRGELNRIARQLKKNKWKWDKKTIALRRALKWFVTFSPRLSSQGPWLRYVNSSGDKSPFNKNTRGEINYTGVYSDENKNREGLARLKFSRLPCLRVLSLDLGHRHAAACAVWKTMSSKQVAKACKKTGCEKPSPETMYHHHIEGGRKVIYRRIGPDSLPESSTTHPAPWARLERQFPIKLQGEEREARMANPDEIWGGCMSLNKHLA